jgi:hypothetical protein
MPNFIPRSEMDVMVALVEMRRDGEVVDFEYPGQHSMDDLLGIDFWVWFKRDDVLVRMPLQVKSRSVEVSKHREKYGDEISVVTAKTKYKTTSPIRCQILSEMASFYSRFIA